jgi:hypothetical protein
VLACKFALACSWSRRHVASRCGLLVDGIGAGGPRERDKIVLDLRRGAFTLKPAGAYVPRKGSTDLLEVSTARLVALFVVMCLATEFSAFGRVIESTFYFKTICEEEPGPSASVCLSATIHIPRALRETPGFSLELSLCGVPLLL